MRELLIGRNWKLYTTLNEAKELANQLKAEVAGIDEVENLNQEKIMTLATKYV